MKCLFALLIVEAVIAFSAGASAAERYFTEEQIAAAGKHCVSGYHGTFGATEVAVKFFAGNVSDLNEQVAAFGRATGPRDAPFVPKYVTKKVVLHPGRKITSRLDQPNRDISVDWSATTWLADPGRLMEFHLQIDIWVGGGINLEDLVIPRGIEVDARRGVLWEGQANAVAQEPKQAQKKDGLTFPYFLPGSRIVIGEDLADEVNALASKNEQIQFLVKLLPPSDQKEKRLSDRQLYAIRLLSLTDSDLVITPLLDRLDFTHKGDAWPASHALGRLGERSVEPVVKKLEAVANDVQKAIMLGNALIEIKQEKYPLFIDELRRRKDTNLSDKLLNELLDVYRFAPE